MRSHGKSSIFKHRKVLNSSLRANLAFQTTPRRQPGRHPLLLYLLPIFKLESRFKQLQPYRYAYRMKWKNGNFYPRPKTSVNSPPLYHKVTRSRLHEPLGQFHTPPQYGREPSSVPMSLLQAGFMMDALMTPLKEVHPRERVDSCEGADCAPHPHFHPSRVVLSMCSLKFTKSG